MEEQKTTIAISNKCWKRLLNRKTNPKETFEDVINKLMEEKNDISTEKNR